MAQENDSQPKHPVIVFRANLTAPATEQIGPNTNARTTGVFSPDTFQTSPDQGRTENSNRASLKSSWIPGLLDGENRVLKNGDTFTLSGEKAVYVKNTYTTGTNPLLTIVSED